MTDILEVKNGMFLMKGGSLVEVEEIKDRPGRFGVNYVQINHDGSEVMGGGSSFAWGAEVFSPITDPMLLAASRCFAAKKAIRELEFKLRKQKEEAETWRRVVQVMHQSKRNETP